MVENINVEEVAPIQIPDIAATGGTTGGFWDSLAAGFSQMSATTWVVIAIIIVCLIVIFSLARKETAPKKK